MSSSLDGLYLLTPEQQDAILNGLAMAPPTGTEPDFYNPPNQNILSRAVTILCITIVTLTLLLRAYAKVVCFRRGVYLGYAYCVFRFIEMGHFVHQWNFRVSTVNKLIYWTCHGLLWFTGLFYFAVEISGNLSCIPFNRIWDKRIPGTCYNRTNLDLTTASVNLVVDILIILLPQRVIWQLQLGIKKKVGISFVFAVGILLSSTVEYSRSPDWTYTMSKMSLWSLAELTCGFMVFCVPAIPKIFIDSKFLSRVVNSLRSQVRSFAGGSKGKGSSEWTNSNAKSANSNTPYHRMGDDDVLLNDMNTMNTINTEEPTDAVKPKIPELHDRIVRTTEFTAIEERHSNMTTQGKNGYNASWE
ncbi:hypothetical protein F5X99DRAFT_417552 [Biscogniauxia marginata]|nr:hypothetical protein F5X99DRAFT_417552 [Biscogniauxia marginata]